MSAPAAAGYDLLARRDAAPTRIRCTARCASRGGVHWSESLGGWG